MLIRYPAEAKRLRLLDWFKTRSSPEAEPPPVIPLVGISEQELVAALAALGPEVDRRILRVQLIGAGRLEISTGHASGPLDADVHEFILVREPEGWRVVSRLQIQS